MKGVQLELISASSPASARAGSSDVLEFRFPRGTAALPAPCFACPHRRLCLPWAVDNAALHDFDGAVLSQRRLRSGQVLYREGDTFRQLHALRSGTVKLSIAAGDQRDQVSPVCMPGDILGLDGIANGVLGGTATAIEDSLVCSIAFATLKALTRRRPQWQESLCHAMAAEVVREQQHMVLLGSYRTEARVAKFLLELSARLEERGYSASEFHLRLSRDEIGSYLGLALETISRTLSAFQHSGWINVHKRYVRLLDDAGLKQVAAGGAF